MSSLTTNFRPHDWQEVIGQQHVTDALRNAVVTKQLHNAYLFVGFHGTGKTTTARILAMALNCADSKDGHPCGKCPSCLSIINSSSLSVKEMDMASNRGIDDIRDIKEASMYSSVNGQYRIFLLDEIHAITKDAASALLKVLEEPPKNCIFILCTTETNKVLPTIRSRCQMFPFKRVDNETISKRLYELCLATGIVDEAATAADEGELNVATEAGEVCNAIAEMGEGSVRDAESALSALVSGGEVSMQKFKELYGAGSKKVFQMILELIQNGERAKLVMKINELSEDITNAQKWAEDFATWLFDKMIEKNVDYGEYLNQIEEYLMKGNQNQPIVFLKLLLVRMCEAKVQPIATQKLPLSRASIEELMKWLGEPVVKINLAGIEVAVGWSNETTGETPFIHIDNIGQICQHDASISPNVLVEKGLIQA